MKKIVFLCSHPYSGSTMLYHGMNQHPRIQGYTGNRVYDSPHNLLELTAQPHKTPHRGAIYMDELLFNHNFYVKSAYQTCKFVYLIREPEQTLNFMISIDRLSAAFAARRYVFRLRRLCEMAKRTPGAVLLTWPDLEAGRGLDLVADYLGLHTPLTFDPEWLNPWRRQFSADLVGYALRTKTENSYQRYLYFLKKQNLRFCQ